VRSMSELALAADSAAARVLMQVVALTRWVGTGRKLTQTGRLTMVDARELVSLLETGDEIDPAIGDRVFRTRSSEDLRGLATVVVWAKAVGLVRVVHGRLVPVKKSARLVDRPRELWIAMFEAFDKLGEAICPSGWYTSLLGHDFADGIAALSPVSPKAVGPSALTTPTNGSGPLWPRGTGCTTPRPSSCATGAWPPTATCATRSMN